MQTIGPLDPVNPSDTLTVTLSYGALLPEFLLTESPVRDAIAPLGHNLLSIDVDTLIGFRKIVIQLHPATGAQAGVIGRDLETAIRDYFYSVWTVSAEKYELGSGDVIFTTQSAVSLASIAILALIGFGVFVYFGGFRK